MDIWTKAKRSQVMSLIRSKNTKPEKTVRSFLHGLGFRFRLHRRDLPGCPDIVMTKYRMVIFVHGCFWHFHKNCRDGKIPKTDSKRWRKKLLGNARRDENSLTKLRRAGWRTAVIWECELRKSGTKALRRIVKQIRNARHIC
ncbi:MAG: DNA mismatch endonuclease Vsr [Acidobacteriota bacterium]|nr:DNA mismatch endonuclease Vsr [Acidobacteriota bacterium]